MSRPALDPASVAWVWAERTGYLRVRTPLGSCVERGEVIGDIRDDFGRPMSVVTASDRGRVSFRVDSLAVTKGELLAGILTTT